MSAFGQAWTGHPIHTGRFGIILVVSRLDMLVFVWFSGYAYSMAFIVLLVFGIRPQRFTSPSLVPWHWMLSAWRRHMTNDDWWHPDSELTAIMNRQIANLVNSYILDFACSCTEASSDVCFPHSSCTNQLHRPTSNIGNASR